MTEREEIIYREVLTQLAQRTAPTGEPMLQALVQSRLDTTCTVAELGQALAAAERLGQVNGLPGATGKIKWSITDTGRHYLINTRE